MPLTRKPDSAKVAVVGLGYVGLPLAVEFGKLRSTIGFDIDQHRIAALREGRDETLETTDEERNAAQHLAYTTDLEDIRSCDVYIVTVPTPIDSHNQPDMNPLRHASENVARVMSANDVVVYESTVYPGATEEVCIPILESLSGLTFNSDFYVGYSPERINPGDKNNRLPTICKITSGSTTEAAEFVDALYQQVVTAGTHLAPSIRVAEAAKVIENTQRDMNIALVNELAMIFGRLGLDTSDVLEAAGTKWNFLPFRPGLVGGHCIGVDPYYLTHKAEAVGYHPEVILSGRRVNAGMGAHVAGQIVKAMLRKSIQVNGGRVLVMGLAFKENCPDVRNTRVVDVVRELEDYGLVVDVHDPWVDTEMAEAAHDLNMTKEPQADDYDAVLLAVAHDQFVEMGAEAVHKFGRDPHVFYDLKSAFNQSESDLRL